MSAAYAKLECRRGASLSLSLAACHDVGNTAVVRVSLHSTPRKGMLPPAAAL